MRKILLTLTTALLSITFCLAQATKPDVIVKKDNTKIEALIKEIDDTTIKYKRFSNPDGPQYSISKEEVVTILYANGEVEVITLAKKPQQEQTLRIRDQNRTTPLSTTPPPTSVRVPPSLIDFSTEIKKKPLEDLHLLYDQARKRKRKNVVGGIWTSIGATTITFIGIGSLIGNRVDFSDLAFPTEEEYRDFKNTKKIGTLILVGGLGLGAFSGIQWSKLGNNKKRLAIIRSELLQRGEPISFKLSPTLNPTQGTAGLRLVATF